MAFYTFCDRVGSRIFHRYVDDNGRRHQEIVSEFPHSLFIRGADGSHKSLFGDKLNEMPFNAISDSLDFIKKYKDITPVFGQLSIAHQFISNSYEGQIEFALDKFRVLNFDIETRFDGADPDEECLVRRVWSEKEETITVGEMRELDNAWEVWDKVNERWYLAPDSPLHNSGGFPNANEAAYEILTISAKVFGSPKKVTFGLKDYKTKSPDQIYTKCENEKDLLIKFINFVRYVDPDALTGWNIEWFDVPYIVNRIKKVLGDEMANKLSPFHAHHKKCITEYWNDDKTDVSYRICGVSIFDYLEFYKRFNPEKQESYKLDDISYIELKENKVDYSEWDNNLMKLYMGDFAKYVEYNEQDVELVERLDKKKQFVRLALTIVLMTKSRYQEVHGKVKLWDNLIYNMLRDEGIVLPAAPRVGAKEQIIGAYVKKPLPAKYRWIVSLDLTALYPSIMMMLNMSPETLVREEQGTLEILEALLAGEDLAAPARARGFSMAANGAAFRNDIQGVLPRAMRYVFDTRKKYKNLMIAEKKKKEAYLKNGGKENTPEYNQFNDTIAMLDATQGAMKVLANSGYGVTAQVSFRYFSKSIAQGITLTGQLVIRYIGARINAKLNEMFGTNRDYIITSDTDSCYITLDGVPSDPKNAHQSVEEIHQFIENKLQPYIDECFRELSEKLGCPKNMLDMKREAISDVGIWRAGKNYVLQVYDMEGVRYAEPQLKMMGIETARSDKPKMVRKRLEEDMSVLLMGTEEQLQKRIVDFKKIFYDAPIVDIAIPKGVSDLSGWVEKDGTHKHGAPGHVRAAAAYNRLIRELRLEREVERIRNGNKIKLFALKKINPLRINSIAFTTNLPEKFDMKQYLDYDTQWENAYLSPIKSFTEILGWKAEKVNTLESLFG